MCNLCKCDNQYQCSIVGNIPLGFCCPKCDYYVEGETCEKLKEQVASRIDKHKEEVEIVQKVLGKLKFSKEDLENYP